MRVTELASSCEPVDATPEVDGCGLQSRNTLVFTQGELETTIPDGQDDGLGKLYLSVPLARADLEAPCAGDGPGLYNFVAMQLPLD